MKTYRKNLYLWVLLGTILGVCIGHFFPEVGVRLKVLGDSFIGLLKILIAPIIFCTIVLGISGGGELKKVGRVGGKALIYFEVISTLALVVGLVVANVWKPGEGFHVDPASLDPSLTGEYIQRAETRSLLRTLTGGGILLPILLFALVFGFVLNWIGKKGRGVHRFIESSSKSLFSLVNAILLVAPLGALGAMAFTIGKYGVASLGPLANLLGCFYLTCVVFISVVLGGVAHLAGFSLFRFIRLIRSELFLVLGTSSSESALAPMMEKLEKVGCSKAVVGLVVPAGYSFNLDGTNIYLTLAIVFLAQAMGIDLSFKQEITLIGVAMLTSKGASGVTGSGFVTLAATLAVVPGVPVESLALILGVDRFMSEARALTNLVGNGVATIVVSHWEGELDREALARGLSAS